jgi:serine phosphatase RsbU (regulator of sigma subunit)
MEYANGSHDMPMLCHANREDINGPRTKKDIEICQGATGMILGHQLESKFPEHRVQIEPGAVLALFTDGIIECKNEQEEMFGKGRFLRSLYKNGTASAKEIRDSLIDQAMKHYGQRERDDDVTLVILKHREDAIPQFVANQAS